MQTLSFITNAENVTGIVAFWKSTDSSFVDDLAKLSVKQHAKYLVKNVRQEHNSKRDIK